MNLLTSLVSRLIGRSTPETRPRTEIIVAEMKAQGDRAEAEGNEYRNDRLSGLESAFFPQSNRARENGYAE